MHYLRYLARLNAHDIHPGGARASKALIEALALQNGQRILELGCGTGTSALRLALRNDVFVVGLDFLEEMLRAAQRKLKAGVGHCALVRANASDLPFFPQSFERVYTESALGIQSSADIRRILSESFRVLKPGGLFVANEAVWKPNVDQSTVSAINRRSEVDFGLRQSSEHAWSADRWLQEIRSAGFQPVSWAELATNDPRRTPRALIARWVKGLRVMSSPDLWRAHRRYRQRLAIHRTDGFLIEARLFVSAKPMAAGHKPNEPVGDPQNRQTVSGALPQIS